MGHPPEGRDDCYRSSPEAERERERMRSWTNFPASRPEDLQIGCLTIKKLQDLIERAVEKVLERREGGPKKDNLA